jgi:hypothetical protein
VGAVAGVLVVGVVTVLAHAGVPNTMPTAQTDAQKMLLHRNFLEDDMVRRYRAVRSLLARWARNIPWPTCTTNKMLTHR